MSKVGQKEKIISSKVGYNFLPGRIGKIIVIRIPLGFKIFAYVFAHSWRRSGDKAQKKVYYVCGWVGGREKEEEVWE